MSDLCLQLVADRLLDAVIAANEGRAAAAVAGRQLSLPRDVFLSVLREVAPRAVARVDPERALAHIAASTKRKDSAVAERARAALAAIGGGGGGGGGVARAPGRLRRWLAGTHGPRELRKARSPGAARRILAAMCSSLRPKTTAAELEDALRGAGAVFGGEAAAAPPTEQQDEPATYAKAAAAEKCDIDGDSDSDISEGEMVAAFWGDDEDDDEDGGANGGDGAARQPAAPAVVRLNGPRLRALAGAKGQRRRRAAAAATLVSETVAVPAFAIAHLIGRGGCGLRLHRGLRALQDVDGVRLSFDRAGGGTATATGRPGPWQARFPRVIAGAVAAYEARRQEWTVLHAKRQRHRLERAAARRRSGRGGRARAGESWAAEKDRRGARRARKLKKRARAYGGHGGKGGGRKHGEGRFSKHRLDRRAGAHLARDSQRRLERNCGLWSNTGRICGRRGRDCMRRWASSNTMLS